MAQCSGCYHKPHGSEPGCHFEMMVGPRARQHVMHCPCRQTGALPVAGERIVFGEHRLPPSERSVPAWAASPAEVERAIRSDRLASPARVEGEPSDARAVDT